MRFENKKRDRVGNDQKKKSDGVTIHHQKKRDEVKVHDETRSDGVRFHHEKERWGESSR